MYKNLMIALIVSLFVSACTIKQTIEPAEISRNSTLCIIENTDVRPGFLKEFQSALGNKGIAHQVVNESDVPADCEWTATYIGKWSWDLALYMSYAEIKIFRNGSLDGEAIYDSTGGSANGDKFIDAEPKIHELVNELLQYNSALLKSIRFS